ncbi:MULTISPECIES: RHS repeat-associated core domain-containing protein [Pseudomonas]|uniref:RHS repeat-associated core domain-containing protein n=1 Tax=Pseudomonas peradeniyensis TaxID=2745488 RepID=A0ABT2V8Z0_9PSED|nr:MULTISPECIES: RHS repeat-associated core domain-containing protein [Pseudomonas]MCU7238145.1 RHS repeat-associated core domain-containing protein [Pseudomonas peradeniyensis]MCU7280385.1 RHS repeat-associated core domain-containing protein [Pseudomonas peradeniyensis]QZA56651.1 RHS repeat-associated core domain-containing protein [Pseudomonas sp. 2hn]
MTSNCLLAMADLQRSVLGGSGPARAYTPYGGHSDKRGAVLAYCGQARDQLTEHYHLGNGHRTFSPFVMRFHSPDRLSPFGVGGVNAYAYCHGDPVNFHDPNGKEDTRSGLAISALAFGGWGAEKVFHHIEMASKISRIETLQGILKENGLPSGPRVLPWEKSDHIKGAISSAGAAVVGGVAGLYFYFVPASWSGAKYADVGAVGAVSAMTIASKAHDRLIGNNGAEIDKQLKFLIKAFKGMDDRLTEVVTPSRSTQAMQSVAAWLASQANEQVRMMNDQASHGSFQSIPESRS